MNRQKPFTVSACENSCKNDSMEFQYFNDAKYHITELAFMKEIPP